MSAHREATLPRPGSLRGPLLFSLAWTALLALLWRVGIARDGSRDLPLTWDSAGFLADALVILASARDGGLGGFWHAWVHVSPDHTPLVPAVSAGFMAVFGPTRAAAELVLPLCTFLATLATVRGAQWLYPASRIAPFATAALFTTFPEALSESRIYLFEWPLAACLAAALWAMLATEGFSRLGPSLVFGLAAGLSALARAGGPALLAGPVAVYALVALREPPRGARARNLAAALLLGAALAATWYLPNARGFLRYVRDVSFGEQSALFTGGEGASRAVTAAYTLYWYVVDGAGVPSALVGVTAWALASRARGAAARSPVMGAFAASLAVSFVPIALVAQRAGGSLLLGLMGFQALALVRAVSIVPRPRTRAFLALLLALGAAHHVYALTIGFPEEPRRHGGLGPLDRWHVPLWNHRNRFHDIVGPARNEPRYGEWMARVVDRVEALPCANRARSGPLQVLVNCDLPLFNAQTFRVEALQRGHAWNASQIPLLDAAAVDARRSALEAQVLFHEVLVVRVRPGASPNAYERTVRDITGPLLSGPRRAFALAGTPLVLENGEVIEVYERSLGDESRPR